MPGCGGASIALFSEPAQVNDAAHALPLRHRREVLRRLSLHLVEVALTSAPHRVDEVIRDLDALAGAAERIGVQHVALEQLDPTIGEVARAGAVANQAANVPAIVAQRAREPAADEAGRSRDEGSAIDGIHLAMGIPAAALIGSGSSA